MCQLSVFKDIGEFRLYGASACLDGPTGAHLGARSRPKAITGSTPGNVAVIVPVLHSNCGLNLATA
jgi:hypothetical protein